MPELTSRLAAVCREHLLREKILVVPSLAIGHQIADAIAHGGTPWVNLRVETMRTIADAVAGFDLAREGLTVLSRAQALAIIERVCDRVLDSSSYFAALADRPGLHRAIQKSIDDLRHAGIGVGDSSPRFAGLGMTDAFEDPRKGRDVVRILEAYEEEMESRRYIDRFGVLRRAIDLLEAVAPRPWSNDAIWIVVEDVELTAAEERLLKLAAGEHETIGAPEGAPENVDFRRAVGEENELRGAFRAILDEKLPFDSAEIVYTARDPYLPLSYELAEEYEIPATFAEGIAAPFTRPGRACLAFLRWIGDGWRSAGLERAARSGAFARPAFARALRRARIGWGRDRYLPRLDPESEAHEIMREMLAITESAVDFPTVAQAASALTSKFALVRNEIDAMAREGLRRMLDELAAIPAAEPMALNVATDRLAEAVCSLHVAASNPRPGFLHVAPVRSAGWNARPRIFVAGLDESRYPGSALQDPIILDVERQSIGIPIAGDRPERMAEQFHRFLGRIAGRRVTFSYASLEISSRRERFPSAAILEMYRAARKPDATYEDLGGLPREGFVDSLPLDGSDWWLHRRFSEGAKIRDAVLESYPGLKAGDLAEVARDSDAITKWDGLIEAAAADLDPRRNGRVYSASQLERMAACPYQHFLGRILNIQPLDDIEFDEDKWPNDAEAGSMFHEIWQQTMTELCARGEKPSLAFLPRMEEISNDALARWRNEVPPSSQAAFDKRRRDVLDSCEVFLRIETTACRTVTPTYFELPFGFESDPPFALDLGHGRSIRLRGRIDRVDRDQSNDDWHVWDYKSGSTYQFDRGGALARGTKVQHAIYARAFESQHPGARVTKSGYFFPTLRGRGARLVRTCTDQELKGALNSLFDVVARGFFPHGDADACKYCDFAAVCPGATEQIGRKLANNQSDPAVQAWMKLQEVR